MSSILLRRHLHSTTILLFLRRHISALPDIEPLQSPAPLPPPPPSPPPPSTPTSKSTSKRNPILQLQLQIRSNPDPDHLTSLLISSLSTIPRLHSSRPLFTLAVTKLSRSRRPDLITSLLSSLLSHPSSPKTDGLLARAISLLSLASLPDSAISTFESHQNFPRSDLSLSALLSALLRARRFDDLKSTFQNSFQNYNITPGRASHNVYLNALCQQGDLGNAVELLRQMRPETDIVSYNTVLAGCLKNGGEEERFQELLKEIRRKGLEPNVVTYNCRIERLCMRGECFEAEELIDVMERKGVMPILTTFSLVIKGFCKYGDVGSAMRVFKKMKVMRRRGGSGGVSPNSEVYIVLMSSLVEKGRWDDAAWICKQCLAMKAAPPFEVVKRLVDGLVKEDKVDDAKSLVGKMSRVVKADAKVGWEKFSGALLFEDGAARPNS